jgi:two-component system phosphate regulon sensor histidine kinase PhoR
MHHSVRHEFWKLIAIAGASLVFGLITGRPFLVAAIGFGLYIAAHLRHLHQLHQWLLSRKQRDVPDAEGLWGDVFNEIRKLERQAGRREDRLTGMLTRFQNVAAVMPDAMVIVSQHDDIEWSNPVAARTLGIRFPHDTGMRLPNLVRNPEFARYLNSGDFTELLEMPAPVNPEITLSVQVVPFGASQKLLVGRDVTRIVRLEQMRRHFVANVSHELRTPLTVLAGYVETLRAIENIGIDELKNHINRMYEQSARMQRLVDDLLTLSRLETTPARRGDEVVDVAALLATLKEQAERLSGEKQHRITLDANAEIKLLGSQEELHSAFSNLIINAVRYTPENGFIQLRWASESDGAVFSVRDSGEGIAPEHLPNLTERFYRVDSARSRASGGTGLGLSIVKHVLRRHDARLDIESQLGQGSVFTCVFPATRVLASQPKTAAPASG